MDAYSHLCHNDACVYAIESLFTENTEASIFEALTMKTGMKVKTAIATMVLLAGSTVWVQPCLADGGYYDRVYGTSGQTYTPRLTPTIRPISQGDYYQQPAYNNYQASYDDQPTLYGYDRRDAPERRTIVDKIEDGFRDLWHSPTIRKGVVGAGAGVGMAALTERNLLKGGLIGAGVGVGASAMDDSYYFKRHPLVRRTGKGALIGLGAAAATSAAALLPAAAVGAGIGAGIHYIKTH
jgi:hypothetical protein